MTRRFKARIIPWLILAGIAAISLFTWVVMLLWNNVLAVVLHLSAITFWQAAGILVLSKILFGGFGGGMKKRRHSGECKNQMHEKWHSMSPEEREKFQHEWRERWHGWKGDVPPANTGSAE